MSAPSGADEPVKPAPWNAAVFDALEWRRFEALCERLFSARAKLLGLRQLPEVQSHDQRRVIGPLETGRTSIALTARSARRIEQFDQPLAPELGHLVGHVDDRPPLAVRALGDLGRLA